ncbi:MAG: [Fe-Fe] hydrogenase large subunit C-terminal domain-containing protein [Bacteroidota bacterium]
MYKYLGNNPLVRTIKDRCRVCYTCVRECPAKAMKIINGQAEVIGERCIACGNCIKVCSQEAKTFYKSLDDVIELFNSNSNVIACIAPSFPAEFTEIKDYRIFVGMLKKLGFNLVVEVSFGADLVAKRYQETLQLNVKKQIIPSDCPAIVFYIRHYHPKLVPYLAPVVSPMVATSRVVKHTYGQSNKTVFIGPCIAKKAESIEVDEVITFSELRELFQQYNIRAEECEASDFDPPHSGKGAIFPVSRGLLENLNKEDSIVDGDIIVAEGRTKFQEAINELEKGNIDIKHMELLCCEGCIMGAGMSKNGKRFERNNKISNYVKKKLENLSVEEWGNQIDNYKNIDLSQKFAPADRRFPKPSMNEMDEILKRMGKISLKDHLNCGACGYSTCTEHAIAIAEGLAENEMCLPYTIEKLHKSIEELNISNEKLASAKEALKQSEKLASMGQLSAGIAHELNNPLGVITLHSNILKDKMHKNGTKSEGLELIVEQADRCKKIVSGLLNFARKNQVKLSKQNIEEFVKHSFDSIIKPDNIQIELESELEDPFIMIDYDQMMQVLNNLEKNAIEAMPSGGLLKLSLAGNGDNVIIKIVDTGIGITKGNMKKLFTPFFTTKKPGNGTGLGLSLIYGIVKMHRGQIDVESNTDSGIGKTGTSFTITIPRL